MITHLSIQNFKGWADTGPIHLAPLTVFFGTNSSGKTSLLQFLLLLKQTAQSSDRQRVLHLGEKQTPVELGTYRDAVFGHDERRDMSFELQWQLDETRTINDPLTAQTYCGDAIRFSAVIGIPEKPRTGPAVRRMSYSLLAADTPSMSVGLQRVEHGKNRGKYNLTFDGYRFVYHQMRKWKPPAPIRFYGFPGEVRNYYKNGEAADDFTFAMETLLRNVYYLGPLRKFPERDYTWSGERPEDVGWQGERAVPAVLAAASDGRTVSRGFNRRYEPFLPAVAHWLRDLGLINNFDVHEAPPGSQRYEVDVQVTRSSQKVSLKDVGFGVSQILPVVVQCFYSPPRSVVIMEQPEIHLHPSVQASLADLFSVAIKARENGADRNTQLIIESHSEHFLRRLQTLIAEKTLTRDDVALYFCSTRKGASVVEEVKVDMFGNVLNWPENFFGDQMGEIARKQKAELERRHAGEQE